MGDIAEWIIENGMNAEALEEGYQRQLLTSIAKGEHRMSQFFQSKSQKKLPYQGKKSKWYTWASSWPAKDKDGHESETVFNVRVNAPSKSPENEDGSPRGCDMMAAAVAAWQNGSDKPFDLKLFINAERTGKQPWMRQKMGEDTFAGLCQDAGMDVPVDDQPIREPEYDDGQQEVAQPKNLFKK